MDILNVVNLSKQIGHTQILMDVSFNVHIGDFVGIIGPNGAGKTTLLKCITGQLVVPKNCVQILNHDIASDSLSAKKCFGYAFDPSILPVQLTGMQFLELIASARHIDLESSNASFFIQMLMLESKMNDQIGSYSQGMKQKLSIISALLGNPPLIVLDESLNGLDPISLYHLKNYLREITQKKESAKMTPEAQEFISKHIEKHITEDKMEPDQAAAVAYEEARKAGFDVTEAPKK